MSETEAKARVVFDFLNKHGVYDFSYEQNKNDFLFNDDEGKPVTRENFRKAFDNLDTDKTSRYGERKRGMKFIGFPIVYSYLQAIGVIFAHSKECDRKIG